MSRLYASEWTIYNTATGAFGPFSSAPSGPFLTNLDDLDGDGQLTIGQTFSFGEYIGTYEIDGVPMPAFQGTFSNPDLVSVLNPSFLDIVYPATLPPLNIVDYPLYDGIFNYVVEMRFNTVAGGPPSLTAYGTIIDRDGDQQFEAGDVSASFGPFSVTYHGTTVIGGTVCPVFRFGPELIVYVPFDGGAFETLTFPDTLPPVTLGGTFVFCFAQGTAITTPGGTCAVEHLAIGDLVVTARGVAVSVRWVGRQTVMPRFAGTSFGLVRIAAGALGGGLPHDDLTVTADHALLIEDLLINAGAMVNGTSIQRISASVLPAAVIVYHIETEAHDVIFANGAACETFIDYAGRRSFDNYAEYLALYGAERIHPEMDRPRITSARMLPVALRERLAGDLRQSA
jgi:hypothetical protein